MFRQSVGLTMIAGAQAPVKLDSEQTVEREFANLLEVDDVSMDDFWKDAINGVQHVHISDFLLGS